MTIKIPKTFMGKPIKGAMERALSANSTQPTPEPSTQPQNTTFPDLPTESFIMSYGGPHGDYFQELITKTNERFSGTKAEIPAGTSGEIQGNLVKKSGLISTIANDSNLRSAGLYPITATQSEHLLQAGKLTTPENNWEDFGGVLYDRSTNGANPQEAQALYDSLRASRQELGLSESDLEDRLIIINPGGEPDSDMPHGVKPIIVPGITLVYPHEILEKVGENPNFDGYGLTGGLPLINQLGSGSRKLYMPEETENIGLRVLCRYGDLDLDAGNGDLAYSDGDGRVNFAPQGRAP
jgi:hypothetical protein